MEDAYKETPENLDEWEAKVRRYSTDNLESARRVVHELLANGDFQKILNKVCRSVFRLYGPSSNYGEWEDLRQEVVAQFVARYDKYERDISLQLILKQIAIKLCRDAARRENARRHGYTKVDIEHAHLEDLLYSSTAADVDARILLKECWRSLSILEREVFYEFFIEDRNPREIAEALQFSRQKIIYTLEHIYRQLRPLITGERELELYGQERRLKSGGSGRSLYDEPKADSAYRIRRSEDELEEMLLKEGLLSEIPPPVTDFTIYRRRNPVKVKGKPISETIIEERR